MKLKKLMLTGALLGTFGSSAICLASSVSYFAVLSGANENPANASKGTGYATYTLTGDTLTVNLSFSGISAPAAAAHIHCCTPVGVNAPVVLPFAKFPASTSGSYTNTFNLSTFAFGGGATEATLIAGLNNGLAYTNIHDMNFPGGEIRGQISAVPEPASLWFLGTGSLGLIGAVRRRMRV